MYKKFDINQTKIKGDCQSERKVVTHNSKNDLPLGILQKMSLVGTAYHIIRISLKSDILL